MNYDSSLESCIANESMETFAVKFTSISNPSSNYNFLNFFGIFIVELAELILTNIIAKETYVKLHKNKHEILVFYKTEKFIPEVSTTDFFLIKQTNKQFEKLLNDEQNYTILGTRLLHYMTEKEIDKILKLLQILIYEYNLAHTR